MRKLVKENYERLHAEGKTGELCDGDVRLIKEWRGYRNVTASNYDTLTSEVSMINEHDTLNMDFIDLISFVIALGLARN